MNEMRGNGFNNIPVASTPTDPYVYPKTAVQGKFRGIFRMYSVQRSSQVVHFFEATPATKRVEVLVTWKYRGVGYENRVVSNLSLQY